MARQIPPVNVNETPNELLAVLFFKSALRDYCFDRERSFLSCLKDDQSMAIHLVRSLAIFTNQWELSHA